MSEDYYIENGNYVFTAAYHLRRGTCCGSGCRHCPYAYEAVILPDFKIEPSSFGFFQSKPVTDLFLAEGVYTFSAACRFVAGLPYRRPAQNTIKAMFVEKNATCSIKHIALKQLAIEQDRGSEVKLMIGIYAMNTENTPHIGQHLSENGLAYIPEAHTYLRCKNKIFDFTTTKSQENRAFANDLLYEIEVDAYKIADQKVALHQAFLKKWLGEQPDLARFSVQDIWKVREKCIAALSRDS